jgi:hypothetical protein
LILTREDSGRSVSSDLAIASMIGGSGRNDVTGSADCHIWRALGSEHTLKECRGFGEPARAGEARGFDHLVRTEHVIHL